ncbi:MAG: MMPL family transporter [Propionibacteriaceae bacterium]|nr:MMPL family transporter [Propionibacteriaceae bacterium]
MSSVLYALGHWITRAKGRVVLAWLVGLALVGSLALTLTKGLDDTITIPGLESSDALTTLALTFPQAAGTGAQYLILAPEGHTVDEPAYATAIQAAADRLEQVEQVTLVTAPFVPSAEAALNPLQPADESGADAATEVEGTVSADRRAALVTAQVDATKALVSQATWDGLDAVTEQLQADLPEGAEVTLGGGLFSYTLPHITLVEVFGVVAAFLVLIINFGSLLAAGMPILVALSGVAATASVIFLATLTGPIMSSTPILALMLGTAVGIDYSLFIISRHRQQLRAGLAPDESIGQALATSGSAVIFAGLTVIVALLGLAVARIPFLTRMGVCAAVGVGLSVLAALTLLPAVLAYAGERLRPGRRGARGGQAGGAAGDQQAGTASDWQAGEDPGFRRDDKGCRDDKEYRDDKEASRRGERFFAGWVALATRRPVVTIIAVILVLGAAALPATGLRLALPDAGWRPQGDHARVTYDRISQYFGEGYNATLGVTASIVTSTDPVGLMTALGDEIRELPDVAAVPRSTPNVTGDTGIVQVIPVEGPTAQSTQDLVRTLRSLHDHFAAEYGIDIKVTGLTAVMIDVSAQLSAALVPFALLVVGLSFVLLTLVFRSLWVPLKATLGYLLSVGAAFGAVVLAFQHGVGADLLNVALVGPVIAFFPIVVMGVLFGLAMDYELFLVSRMREEYVQGTPARAAVTAGFMGSARVVTAAAVIMFLVFTAFVPESDQIIKPMALGLAVGVFCDAFLVRMTLVPAVLTLLGDRAWRLPRWLDERLPRVDVEGAGLAREIALRDWPEPATLAALAARQVPVPTATKGEALEWTTRVEPGQVHAVVAADATVTTAALLLATGRLRPEGGWLKALGTVLPGRAGRVRARSCYLDVAAAPDPVRALERALGEDPDLLALDGLDRLGAAEAYAAVHRLLGERDPDLTVLVATRDAASLAPLVTPDSYSLIPPTAAIREEVLV